MLERKIKERARAARNVFKPGIFPGIWDGEPETYRQIWETGSLRLSKSQRLHRHVTAGGLIVGASLSYFLKNTELMSWLASNWGLITAGATESAVLYGFFRAIKKRQGGQMGLLLRVRDDRKQWGVEQERQKKEEATQALEQREKTLAVSLGEKLSEGRTFTPELGEICEELAGLYIQGQYSDDPKAKFVLGQVAVKMFITKRQPEVSGQPIKMGMGSWVLKDEFSGLDTAQLCAQFRSELDLAEFVFEK